MNKSEFNKIRSRLEMREKQAGEMKPVGDIEIFVCEIIKQKKELNKRVEEFKLEEFKPEGVKQ